MEDTEILYGKKLLKALSSGLTPILCCGESLKQRENGETLDFIKKQIVAAFAKVEKEDVKKVVVAYEPIWAIGTGKTATSKQAEEVCAYIRKVIAELYDKKLAEEVSILYGGSVNGKNAKELFSKKNIDGALVGGASLKSEFADITKS